MSTVASPSTLVTKRWFEPDRIGVYASVLCAIHCVLTPILLLMLPTFGRAWSHPASHWGMALFVVPVAAFALTRGFQRHRRRWVVGAGVLGIALILVGAATPYLSEGQVPAGGSPGPSSTPSLATASVSEEDTESAIAFEVESEEEQCASECESEEQCASECESAAAEAVTAECEDLCCPTLQASADGGWKLHIPLASILTTLGGLSLIVTHLGNLCCCPACAKQELAA